MCNVHKGSWKQTKQVQRDIGPTMEIAKGLSTSSTIEYPYELKAMNLLQKNLSKYFSINFCSWKNCFIKELNEFRIMKNKILT